VGESGNTLFVVSGGTDEETVQRLAGSYEGATFMWRYACASADYDTAMSGCFLLLRFEIKKYKIVIMPVDYVKLFFGSAISLTAPTELSSGRVVIPYTNFDSTLYAEYVRVTSKMASI
jgi:hypothetical protein